MSDHFIIDFFEPIEREVNGAKIADRFGMKRLQKFIIPKKLRNAVTVVGFRKLIMLLILDVNGFIPPDETS